MFLAPRRTVASMCSTALAARGAVSKGHGQPGHEERGSGRRGCGRAAPLHPRPALPALGCARREQRSCQYLSDFGCPISHGQRTAETSRDAREQVQFDSLVQPAGRGERESRRVTQQFDSGRMKHLDWEQRDRICPEQVRISPLAPERRGRRGAAAPPSPPVEGWGEGVACPPHAPATGFKHSEVRVCLQWNAPPRL